MKVIVIDRSAYTLELHVGETGPGKLIAAYPIAIGMPRYKTPRGTYFVANKIRNPDWWIPDSKWARDLGLTPGEKISGDDPNNPLVARWIGIDPDEQIGIHGTNTLSSLGSAASHGCIRMDPEDVIELYEEIPHPPSEEHPDGKVTPVIIE